ncbi:MAG: hypothetical protein DDT32_02239 [Syntrophomonadaceae bacterium]|nr:hypothetical protein [Bacillota bacterium]
MKRKVSKVVSVILTVMLLFSVSVTPVAAGQENSKKQGYREIQNIEKELPYAIELVEPYVERSDRGTFRFSKGLGVLSRELGLSTEILVELQKSMNEVNKHIMNGDLRSDKDLRVFPVNEQNTINTSTEFSILSFTGINRVETFWWGIRRHACFFESQRIVADFGSASAVGAAAAVAANIWAKPISAFAGLATAYYALLASRIAFHNVSGRGTIIDLTWVLVFSVRSQ